MNFLARIWGRLTIHCIQTQTLEPAALRIDEKWRNSEYHGASLTSFCNTSQDECLLQFILVVTVVLAMLVSISLSLCLSVSHCRVTESVDSVERFQMELYAGQARPSTDYDHWKRRLISSVVYNMPCTRALLSNCTKEPTNMLFSPKNNWSMSRDTMSTILTVCLHFLWAAGRKSAFFNPSLGIDFEWCCFVLSFTFNTHDCNWKKKKKNPSW